MYVVINLFYHEKTKTKSFSVYEREVAK